MNRIDDFITHFKDYQDISQEDIFKYFHAHGKTKDASIRSLLSRWKKQDILYSTGKGIYRLTGEKKKLFKISADKHQERLAKLFKEQYPELKYAIWNTDILNRLMVHQHFNSFYIFETESDVLDNVFYLLKEHKFNVFMAADEDVIQKYMYDAQQPIIIKKLVSRSPLVRKDKVSHPAVEKILVDIFVDKLLFNFLQGSELINIYRQMFDNYVVNITKLLSYADRRKTKNEISAFIRENITNSDITALL